MSTINQSTFKSWIFTQIIWWLMCCGMARMIEPSGTYRVPIWQGAQYNYHGDHYTDSSLQTMENAAISFPAKFLIRRRMKSSRRLSSSCVTFGAAPMHFQFPLYSTKWQFHRNWDGKLMQKTHQIWWYQTFTSIPGSGKNQNRIIMSQRWKSSWIIPHCSAMQACIILTNKSIISS